jgi:GNAT superfamily N-acetyltransferase
LDKLLSYYFCPPPIFTSLREATIADKNLAIRILSEAFDTNNSVNWIVGNRLGREKRIYYLMEYAFEYSLYNHLAFINDTNSAIALCLRPAIAKHSFKTFLLMVLLPFRVMGLSKTLKLTNREKYIHSHHPGDDYLNIWFICVDPQVQGKGNGGELLKRILNFAEKNHLTSHLETSNTKNLPFYKKHGFELFHEWDGVGYVTYFFRKSPKS